jgi:hypothetical protein
MGTQKQLLLVIVCLLALIGAVSSAEAGDRERRSSRAIKDRRPAAAQSVNQSAGRYSAIDGYTLRMMQEFLGKRFKMARPSLRVFQWSLLPVGALALLLGCAAIGERRRGLIATTILASFFHRLIFIVAFWCIITSQSHETFAMGKHALFLLTNAAIAAMVIAWWLPSSLSRIVVLSVLFCSFDTAALASALFASKFFFA